MATTGTAISNEALAQLPKECWNEVFLHLSLSELRAVGSTCQYLHLLLFANHDTTNSVDSEMEHSNDNNNEFWNCFLCQRTWIVDPTVVLSGDKRPEGEPWMQHFRTMLQAEQDRQRHLDRLSNLDLDGWLERHFIGELHPIWNGWERRYWSWDTSQSAFLAWTDDSKWQCMATFKLCRHSQVRRVAESEQVEMTSDTNNPVRAPKPFVFTISHTDMPMLYACQSEEVLQLWMDKIEVTVHPLKFQGASYRAPARFKMNQSKRKRSST